mmetsp:Transcript_42209/g.99061  ORF Transcript_42209/g.99061 Transcript_42209/m.99061 type:complete len:85 (+) Transcript_42209:1356-1610(+)
MAAQKDPNVPSHALPIDIGPRRHLNAPKSTPTLKASVSVRGGPSSEAGAAKVAEMEAAAGVSSLGQREPQPPQLAKLRFVQGPE